MSTPVLCATLYAVQSIAVVYRNPSSRLMNLIIGVSGSVATIKLKSLIENLQNNHPGVRKYYGSLLTLKDIY